MTPVVSVRDSWMSAEHDPQCMPVTASSVVSSPGAAVPGDEGSGAGEGEVTP
jgi:hypothetical protein